MLCFVINGGTAKEIIVTANNYTVAARLCKLVKINLPH